MYVYCFLNLKLLTKASTIIIIKQQIATSCTYTGFPGQSKNNIISQKPVR